MNPENRPLLTRVCKRAIGIEAYKKARSAGETRPMATVAWAAQVFTPTTITDYEFSSPFDPAAIITVPMGFVIDMAVDMGPTFTALLLKMEPSLAIPILALSVKGLYNSAIAYSVEK